MRTQTFFRFFVKEKGWFERRLPDAEISWDVGLLTDRAIFLPDLRRTKGN